MQKQSLLFRSAAAAALIFLGGMLPLSAGSNGNATIVATLQGPPVKDLSDHIMGLARVVSPGQQTEMLPLLFLGAFGYPEFAGVSRTAGFSVFVFEADEVDPMPFVILAKISDTSPLGQVLPMFEWTTRRHGEWLLISKDAASLNRVGDVEALIAHNERPRPFLLTLRSLLEEDTLDNMAENFKSILRERHLQAAGGQAPEIDLISKTRFVDFATEVLKNIQELDTGLEISASGLGVGLRVQAHEGTPEAALLSAGSAGPVTVARYVDASYPVIYISSIDHAPVKAYTRSILQRAGNHSGAAGRAFLQQLETATLQWLERTDGTSAGAMRLSGKEPESISVIGGSLTEAEFTRLMNRFYGELIPQMFQLMPYFESRYLESDFDYRGTAGEVDGVPVHNLAIRMQPQRGSALQGLPETDVESETYLAVVDGKILSAQSRTDLAGLVQAVAGTREVTPNVASLLRLEPGEVSRFHIDLKPIAMESLGTYGEMAGPGMADQIKHRLQDAKLAPLAGSVSTGGGVMTVTTLLPASTLATLSSLYQDIQLERMQQK